MNRRFESELHPGLTGAVNALDAPSAHMEQRAQQRLLARLRAPRVSSRTVPIRWWATAVASVLAMVIVAVPLLSDRGNAFANALAHFRDFRTLSMQVEQRFDGRVLQASRMVVDGQGRLRTDVGDLLSVVVDPVQGRVLMLQHGPKAAMSFPMEAGDAPAEDELGWLDQLREFQGEARQLEATRVMDGKVAHGWALDVDGTPIVLWVDGSDLPLAMETGGEGGLSIHYRFAFDVALPAGYLSSEIPEGYQPVERDTH